MRRPALKFDVASAQDAWVRWGANCGPGALAAIAEVSLETAVLAIPDFVQKGHTKETMMREACKTLGVSFTEQQGYWPSFGLARILWNGPWTGEGLIARFQRSHWVAHVIDSDGAWIFDINAVGLGWMPRTDWEQDCVPWILARHVPQADGTWAIWESFEVVPRLEARPG
jgi:hypothetical protein